MNIIRDEYIYVLQLKYIYIGKICCKKCIEIKYNNYKLLDFKKINKDIDFNKILNEYIYYYAYNFGLKNIKMKRDIDYKYCKCEICNDYTDTKNITISKNRKKTTVSINKLEPVFENKVIERINYKRDHGIKKSINPLITFVKKENKKDKKKNDKLRLYGLK